MYPLPSPNGSTVIVCGHGQGLLILWRGGRPFKSQNRAPGLKPVNGTSNHAIMIIDSDEEEPARPSEDTPDFEENEEEHDVSEPYHPIIQTLDLTLELAVLHLSFPCLPSKPHESTMKSLPRLLSDRIIIAMACSDFSIRVLTIPLMPPSPQSKMRTDLRGKLSSKTITRGVFGEQMIVLSGGNGHRSVPKGVSVTATAHRSVSADANDMNIAHQVGETEDPFQRFSSPRVHDQNPSIATSQQWDLLVASHSSDFSGLLLIHRIAIIADTSKIDTSLVENNVPWQTQYLTSQAISIQFNSSIYPAPRHSELLITDARGLVRIFDCLPQHESHTEGSWLISLYTAFQTAFESVMNPKSVLSAQWCLGGKAILVLLADGEWGIWDLENDGPKAKRGLKSNEGITGKVPSDFVVSGWISTSNAPKTALKDPDKSRGLAPMTPGTRKVRQEHLFAGSNPRPNGLVRGGISVSSALNSSKYKPDDESILLWHGDNIAILPSLLTYWQNTVRGTGNLFGTEAKGRFRRVGSASLGGEVRNEVSLFPEPWPSGVKSGTLDQNDILIAGERSVIIMAPPIADTTRVSLDQPKTTSPTDQRLLALGELDVDGMDRILADMSNSPQTHDDYVVGSGSVIKA